MKNTDKDGKKRVIQFRIDETLLNDFNRITEEESINKSALIRSWIEKFIKEHKRKSNGRA
ncbi:hypothetical protein [Dialister succinatiphilus]|uniref:hypothetical protein n=1 Tax=Dialister succinatiphilus TaxID=487173 RepID=UPI003AF0A5B8